MESSGHRCLAATTAHARRLADDRLVSHVTRRLPSAWPRAGRLGGAVHGTGGRPARAAEDRAGRDLDTVVLPGLTQWQSPGWFAYFPANTSPPSILGELVTAALGAQGMLWSTSPAVTEIEAHVVDWLVDLLGLPQEWKTAVGPGGGVIQMSASDSTHVAHVVARQLAVDRDASTDDVVAYSSSQAHSSIEKGARVAGIRHVRLIDVDERFALRPDALARAIER